MSKLSIGPGAVVLLALLSACSGAGNAPVSGTLSGTLQAQNRAQSRPQQTPVQTPVRAGLEARFSTAEAVPAELLTQITQQAQAYADDLSRRREIDFFRIHAKPVGLKFSLNGNSAWLLSFLGSSRDRQDLNLELRAFAGSQLGLNLNYSGPVTLGRSLAALNGPPDQTQRSRSANNPFSFELITGLPGQGVTDTYGDYLNGLGQYLRYRYQAQPIEFDDAPLIFAIQHQGQLQGFAFLNQRNRLILGERKYADVQNVAVVSTDRRLLGSYTLIGFNPKVAANAEPDYKIENHPEFGTLVQFGEL